MKMRFLFFWTFTMLICCSLNAQTLSPISISSSGGFFSVGGNSLSFTLAEMTMVQTFAQPTNILTQGFQQPELITTDIVEFESLQGEIVIYPNPSNGQFNIGFNANFDDYYQVKIYNMVGQIVFAKTYVTSIGLNTITLNLNQLGQGIYMLELSSASIKEKQKTSIHKINLIY